MDNVVSFPRPNKRRINIITTPKTPESRANVAQMAAAAIATLAAVNTTHYDKINAMAQAAKEARDAIRRLHLVAVAHNERPWALRVIYAETEAIKAGLERGDT